MSVGEIPDRRLAPRPLPAHLFGALGLWLSSRAALPLLKTVSQPSNETSWRLHALAGEIDAFGFEPVAAALDAEIACRATDFINGLEAYRNHPFRRSVPTPPVLWQEGASRLLDYGDDSAERAVFVVPSLVNRYYVLDLLPERSFVRHLAGHRLRPLVLDWGEPGPLEYTLDLSAYIERLDRAFTAAARSAGRPLALLGYCMGGLLALALALRHQDKVSCVALLATPWNFDAGRRFGSHLIRFFDDYLGALDVPAMPVEIIQSLFFWLDPFLAQRKFVRFSTLDPASYAARSFVALEDWLNDGVPLSKAVARECLRSWYRDNVTGRGLWQIAGRRVQPEHLRRPVIAVIPDHDRIVPPPSAEALAVAIPHCEVLRPALGHIGMMAATRAPETLWFSIAERLTALMGVRS
jgi:polyhydroxyalkanoate synthase subunit PhaC